jgi:hypothetical protein
VRVAPERRRGEDRQAGDGAAERGRPAPGKRGILERLLGDGEARRREPRPADLADARFRASTRGPRLAGDAQEKGAGGGVAADLGYRVVTGQRIPLGARVTP